MWGTAFKLGLGWAGGEYASAGKRDNFDKGEEEDDAAHSFFKKIKVRLRGWSGILVRSL